MKKCSLSDMIGGWFIGNFEPSIEKNTNAEVAIKKYKAGDSEKEHLHKIASEITVILSGSVIMFNTIFSDGDIILIEPGESTAFKAITDVTTVVVKTPSIKDDKYFI